MDERNYVQQVVRHLKCSKAKREEVRKELTADIASAMEAGESWDKIRARMGMPKAAAKEFNDNFSPEERKKYRNKKILIVTGIIAAALVVLIVAGYWLLPKVSVLDEKSGFREEQVVERAKEVIGLFEQEKFADVVALGDDKFRASLGNGDQLAQAKENISANWGSLQSYGKPYTAQVKQAGVTGAVVQINASYENVNVIYTVTLDEDLKLIGFFIR